MSNRASYQHHHNLRLGASASSPSRSERGAVRGIGVYQEGDPYPIVRLPFCEATIRNIAMQNPDLSALTLAVRLATGSRVSGFFANSTCGISRVPVIFRGLK